MRVLVFNVGSTSIKYDVYDMATERRLARGDLARDDADGKLEAVVASIIDRVVAEHGEPAAVGHRVVHGGERLIDPTLLDRETERAIEACAELAPLHNPLNLRGIRAARRALPRIPQIAVFDTAFHATLPARSYLYALPYELYLERGVRRFGSTGRAISTCSRARRGTWRGRPPGSGS